MTLRGVEDYDIASGKGGVKFTGAVVLTNLGPNLNSTGNKIPARAIVVNAACTVKLLDDSLLELPDFGVWQWDIQMTEVTVFAGLGIAIY